MRRFPLLIISVVSLAACTSKEGSLSAGGATGGTFIVAGIGEAVDVFPPFVSENNGAMVQNLVFDKLAEIGPAMSTIGDKDFQPQIAKSWTWAKDSMSIAFNIDPHAR